MNRLRIYLVCLSLVFSCKPLYKAVNGINKVKSFEDLGEYHQYIKRKTNLNIEDIYIVNQQNYNDLVFDIANRNVIYYYGIFKDNQLIASGSDLKDKNSCYGSILQTLKKNITSDTTSNDNKNSEILDFSYLNSNNQQLNLDLKEETIVFVYSYKLGKLSNNLEKLIAEVKKNEEEINYIIISLDNSSIQNIKTKIQY